MEVRGKKRAGVKRGGGGSGGGGWGKNKNKMDTRAER